VEATHKSARTGRVVQLPLAKCVGRNSVVPPYRLSPPSRPGNILPGTSSPGISLFATQLVQSAYLLRLKKTKAPTAKVANESMLDGSGTGLGKPKSLAMPVTVPFNASVNVPDVGCHVLKVQART